jgi:hypothetical protein
LGQTGRAAKGVGVRSSAGSATPCGNCGEALLPAFEVQDINRAIGDDWFKYFRCSGCGSYELNNVPDDLSPFYPESYYELPETPLLPSLAPNEAHKVRMIAPWRSSGKLVEVGPGAGVFSFCASRSGFDVTAVEMDTRTCDYMRTQVGVSAVESEDPASELRALAPVSVIALWHVIEHLRDPWGFIDAAAESLEPGGVLALSAPNPESLQFRALGSRWAHVDAPRHLFLIPLPAIVERAARSGLRLAYATTGDPSGRHWNRFGWEMAMKTGPRGGPPGRVASAASLALTLALRPLEGTGMRGAAYSAVFAKEDR